MAAALLDDPVDGREAEPSPLADALGREERLEEVGLGLGVHPHSRVAHGEKHVRAGVDVGLLAGIRLVQLDVRGLDGEPPSLRHGVPRVDGQVQDDLLELPRVGPDPAEHGFRRRDEVDVLADQPPEQRLHPSHHDVHVEHPRLEDLLPAKRQELLGERGGAARGLGDQVDVPAGRLRELWPRALDLGAAADHREQVVEVVRHPAREPPDRLHLLGLPEVVLEPLSLGHVDERCEERRTVPPRRD